jgi:hypothetical protein
VIDFSYTDRISEYLVNVELPIADCQIADVNWLQDSSLFRGVPPPCRISEYLVNISKYLVNVELPIADCQIVRLPIADCQIVRLPM